MMSIRQAPRTWTEISESLTENPFSYYSELLEDIDFTVDKALLYFTLRYEMLRSEYTDTAVMNVFEVNLLSNSKKYEDLANLYKTDIDLLNPFDITESYTDVRTPDLTSESSSSGESSTSSSRNQTATTTNTPGVTTTQTHSVNPFDNSGMRSESEDLTEQDGYNTTTVSYSGDPDSMESETSASSTVTSTGTETFTHEMTRSGRDGRFKVSELIDDAEAAAVRLNIIDIICEDIANKLFLQVW